MNTTIHLSNNQVSNFQEVWLELLKKKIGIIHEISVIQNVNFLELLKEFVPEAFDKNIEKHWKDDYIINNKSNTGNTYTSNCNNITKSTTKPKNKKLMLKKVTKPKKLILRKKK